MSQIGPAPEGVIWATRGRSWGFRFLLNGGFADPLQTYERMFSNLENDPIAWRRTDEMVALRFPDPLGRRDESGRVIPHEFVVVGGVAKFIGTVDEGVEQIWPRVADVYARVWDAERPPSESALGFES